MIRFKTKIFTMKKKIRKLLNKFGIDVHRLQLWSTNYCSDEKSKN